MRKVRVQIVEDSYTVRMLLGHLIKQDPRLHLISSVESGEDALRVLNDVKPDVLSLDIRLPGMDGFEVTREVMRRRPTPIVVCSASVESDDLQVSMNALSAGALSVVEKPVGESHEAYEQIAARLCSQLYLMSQVKVLRRRFDDKPQFLKTRDPWNEAANVAGSAAESMKDRSPGTYPVVGIVASTGGPPALAGILGSLPADYPAPILLVQHITGSFHSGLVDWLQTVTPLNVMTAVEGDQPLAGNVYLAPPHAHLQLHHSRFRFARGPEVSHHKPSGTVMLSSIAADAGERAIGVVLTGMGEDGAAGLEDMRRAGAWTIAQDEATSVVYGMPRQAVQLGAVRETLSLQSIGPRLCSLLCTSALGV